MRAVTFTLDRPTGPYFAYRLFGAESELERDRIYHLNVLADETVVLLGRVRGDPDEVERLLDGQADVLGYSISGTDDRGGLVYVHARAPPVIRGFLNLPRTHEVFFDFPIDSTSDGRLRVVMIGETNEVVREALADLPADLDVTIERIGPYPETGGSVVARLTDRQREVLDVALELGYYEVPRRATHRDIAERLDRSVATVGEHLQKIESRVFAEIRP